MILHTLRFSFRETTSPDEIQRSLDALARFRDIESVSSAWVGACLGDREGYTHALCVHIDDLEAFERYQNDPVHREADFVLHPHVARLAIFDISDDPDPEFESALADVVRRRLAGDPEVVALISGIPEFGSDALA